MPRELPIFPLPIVLFPGAPQPLHIFEPRYRQLLSDSLAGDRRFGVTYVTPPRAPGEDPAPSPGDLGCVALIRSTQQLPDGRSNILAVGERRFVLVEWCAGDRPYRLGRVEEFDDEPGDQGEAEAIAVGVRQDFTRLVRALGLLTDREHDSVELPGDPQALSFQVSAALELDAASKRSLLALRSTTARLRHLGAVLEPLATDAERRAAVRHRAKGNGRGGRHPQIEHTP
jgi:ATP-dependent Lon protease